MTLPFPLPAPGASSLDLHLLAEVFGAEPFTAAQALALGVGRRRLHALQFGGSVTSQLQGVFRVGDEATTFADRAQLVKVLLPPGAVVARRTAAWLHGFDPRRTDAEPLELECVVDRGTPGARRAGVRCLRSQISGDDETRASGIRVTTPARTAADLLRFTDPPMALAVADAMARAKLLRTGEVRSVLQRQGGRFVGRAWRMAGWIEPRAESFAESWLRLRMLDAGFPRPVAQVPVRGSGGRVVYRIDLGWPQARVGVEYDGEEFHTGARHREADRARRERLRRDFGWHVIGVGRGEVLGHHLDLELGLGELLNQSPAIRRRRW